MRERGAQTVAVARPAQMCTEMRRCKWKQFQMYYVIVVLLCCIYLWREPRVSAYEARAINGTTAATEVSAVSTVPVNRSAEGDGLTASPIAPFPQLASLKTNPGNLNRTLDLLDLWQGDGNCTDYQVQLLEDGSVLEPGALVSFPGSGNSWLRMLLMGVTGVFVSSVYGGEDGLFQSKGNSTYPIPGDCGCTLLKKTHDFTLDASLFYLPVANRTHVLEDFKGKGVLIIRNPYSAIRSYRNFDSGGMQGTASEEAFKGPRWDNFVSRSIASWETLATVWIRGLKQGGVVYYERLRHDTRAELTRMLHMIGVPYDAKRLDCSIRHAEDNSFRRDPKKTIADPYTYSQKMLIHQAIDHVQLVLKERGLAPLPLEHYTGYEHLQVYGVES